MAMRRIFWGFCRNWFLIDPLHYLSSRSDFRFEFAEIFVIEKRLPYSASRRLCNSPSRGVRESSTSRLGESGSRYDESGSSYSNFLKFFITLNSYTSPLKDQFSKKEAWDGMYYDH
jgi:hypothetical protein